MVWYSVYQSVRGYNIISAGDVAFKYPAVTWQSPIGLSNDPREPESAFYLQFF